MGKKGSWFSAIKRVFVPNSKEKVEKGSEKKSVKEKNGRGILKRGETKSFFPLFREPSSIEKILGELDEQQLKFRPPTLYEQPNTPLPLPTRPTQNAIPRATSPRATSPRATSPRATSLRATSPRATTPRDVSRRNVSTRIISPRVATTRAASEGVYRPRPEPTLRNHQRSATKIQAAYRGYMARKSFKALKGLGRLQGVVRGQNVKRQTKSAMKHMQLLVRVQTQIQSRRIQMLENQAVQHQVSKSDRDAQSTLGKSCTQLSESGYQENWDDSLLTKEEIEARMQKKAEAVVKRERAMIYAYSNQLWKSNQKSGQTPQMDIRSGGTWWWTWMERQLPSTKPSEIQPMKNFFLTPSRPTQGRKPSPLHQSNNSRQHSFADDILETPTPRSSKSAVPARTRHLFTPSSTPATKSSNLISCSRPRKSDATDSSFGVPLKDDDSLMSCPAFSVPNYMTPTASTKAKVRPSSNPKERFPSTPGSVTSKKRFSFPLTPSIGPFKWNKGSSKDSTPQKVFRKYAHSVGNRSVDSAMSMPAVLGRKPFNRFV